MEGTIKVDTSKLRSTAIQFNSTGSTIRTMTNNMTNTVNSLSGCVWSGEAANNYKRKFNRLRDDIERMLRMINEHVTDLQDMAQRYELTESQNAAVTNGYRDDVIH